MSKDKEEEKNDNPFDGWDNPEDVDFFGEEAPKVDKETKETLKEVEEEDDDKKDNDDPEEKIKKEEKEIEDSLFVDDFEEEEEDDPQEPKDKSDKSKKEEPNEEEGSKVSPKLHVEFLKEKGLIDFELDEDEELTDERAEEILEDSYEDSIESRIEEKMEGLPDIVKEIVKFSSKGGDVKQLLGTISSNNESGIKEGIDLEKEKNQEKVVRHQLKQDGYDDDIIDAQVEFFKESGKLEETSQKFYKKIIEGQKSQMKKLLDAQNKQKENQKKSRREYKKKISDFISKNTDDLDIKLSRKDKNDLPSYISEQSIKLENGNSISGLQKDIFEALKDEKKTVMLAKVLKSDFDFSDFIKEAETKVTKKTKKELRHTETKTPSRSKGGKVTSKKALADYF